MVSASALSIAVAPPHLARREPDQRQRRLRAPAQRVRLAQRLLGALEVALQPAKVADRIQAVGHDRQRLERLELGRRLAQLLLGALPAPLERDDLGAMDAADAREPADRLGLAPLVRHLDPLAGPLVVGEVATGGDHLARGDPGRERRQLAVHGGDRGFLEDPDALGDRATGDLHRGHGRLRERLEVGVVRPCRDRDRLRRQLEGPRDVAGGAGDLALHQRQEPVGGRLGLALQDPFGTPVQAVATLVLPRRAWKLATAECRARRADRIAIGLVRRQMPARGGRSAGRRGR